MNAFQHTLARLRDPQWHSALRQLNRGLEREALRIQPNGHLAQDPHPKALGAALTHPWITTDFSESLMELITPVFQDPDALLAHLADTHTYVLRNLDGQHLWPMSMPCFIDGDEHIPLARYGSSHAGRMKTLYREGLKRRYGARMQAIAGLHFNFSLPDSLWPALGIDADDQDAVSERYFSLLRYFKRHAWVVTYLFGASPSLCRSFLGDRDTGLPFEENDGTLYLPYATSLRMSDLGYTNRAQDALSVSLDSVQQYVADVKRAISVPSEDYAAIGVKVDGEYRQLNANVLQIENELYSSVRPKRTTKGDEKPSEALSRGGVEYIEVRALDVNPFSPLGLEKSQILLLDLFLLDGALEAQPKDDDQTLAEEKANFQAVVIDGRRPGKTLQRNGEEVALSQWLAELYDRWQALAECLDQAHGDSRYRDALALWQGAVRDPEQTLSGRVLKQSLERGFGNFAKELAQEHRATLLQREYRWLDQATLDKAAEESLAEQSRREAADQGNFDQFLSNYFGKAYGK